MYGFCQAGGLGKARNRRRSRVQGDAVPRCPIVRDARRNMVTRALSVGRTGRGPSVYCRAFEDANVAQKHASWSIASWSIVPCQASSSRVETPRLSFSSLSVPRKLARFVSLIHLLLPRHSHFATSECIKVVNHISNRRLIDVDSSKTLKSLFSEMTFIPKHSRNSHVLSLTWKHFLKWKLSIGKANSCLRLIS